MDDKGLIRSAVNWCTNDYLALGSLPELVNELACKSRLTGISSGGTRNISGTTIYHKELENALAYLHGKEAALLFNGAYQANVTTLQTLGRHLPGLVILSDASNHASIIEGIRTSGAEKKVFAHNDVQQLEELLKALPEGTPRLIVFESVYSMSGTVAPIKEILALAKKYHALTYIDEVHAVGLYGIRGAGKLEELGLSGEVDIINGTLSKAIGIFGGYITATHTLIDFIRSFGSGFIFTTSLPPAICHAATRSIEWIRLHPDYRACFFRKVQCLREALTKRNIYYSGRDSHITRIPIQGAKRCKKIAEALLLEYGIYLQPINYPTVAKGDECLRVIVTPKHSKEHIEHLADSLQNLLYERTEDHRAGIQTLAFADR
jgi:5-aminolevulinate synthase